MQQRARTNPRPSCCCRSGSRGWMATARWSNVTVEDLEDQAVAGRAGGGPVLCDRSRSEYRVPARPGQVTTIRASIVHDVLGTTHTSVPRRRSPPATCRTRSTAQAITAAGSGQAAALEVRALPGRTTEAEAKQRSSRPRTPAFEPRTQPHSSLEPPRSRPPNLHVRASTLHVRASTVHVRALQPCTFEPRTCMFELLNPARSSFNPARSRPRPCRVRASTLHVRASTLRVRAPTLRGSGGNRDGNRSLGPRSGTNPCHGAMITLGLYPVTRDPVPYRDSSTLTKLLAVLLLLVAGALVFTVIQNRHNQGVVMSVEPRPIAQRPDDKLGADEQGTIDIFSKFSRSVVNVTSLATRTNQITLDVTQIKQGTEVRDSSGIRPDTSSLTSTSCRWATARLWSRSTTTPATPLASSASRPTRISRSCRSRRPPRSCCRCRSASRRAAQGRPERRSRSATRFGLDQTLTTGVIIGLGREIKVDVRRD